MFLCLIDFECWIKLLFPPLLYFLSWLHHWQLKVSLSKYCAQSPTRSPHASLSPSHPGCQFIVAFWADVLVSLPGILLQNASLKYMLSMFAWIGIGHNSNGEKYCQQFAHRYIHIISPIHSFHNWMQHNLSCDCEHGRHCLNKSFNHDGSRACKEWEHIALLIFHLSIFDCFNF